MRHEGRKAETGDKTRQTNGVNAEEGVVKHRRRRHDGGDGGGPVVW